MIDDQLRSLRVTLPNRIPDTEGFRWPWYPSSATPGMHRCSQRFLWYPVTYDSNLSYGTSAKRMTCSELWRQDGIMLEDIERSVNVYKYREFTHAQSYPPYLLTQFKGSLEVRTHNRRNLHQISIHVTAGVNTSRENTWTPISRCGKTCSEEGTGG